MKRSSYNITGVILLLTSWFILSDCLQVFNTLLFPPLIKTLKQFRLSLSDTVYWYDLWSTLYRWFGGLFIGGGLGIITGIIMGKSPRLYALCEVPLDFMRSLPVSALFPLYLLVFGIGDASKIALSATISFFYLLINAFYGVRYAEPEREIAARIMGASNAQIFFTITLFEALPMIFVGIRTAISFSFLATVVSEMFIGSDSGIGYRIYESYLSTASELLYVMILTAGICGVIFSKALILTEKKIIFWVLK